MYKAEELQNLQMKPRINDITLKVLADYYAFFLNPFIYKYKGIDGWHNIYGENEEGFILDIPHLKTLNKKNFKSIKAKFVYFYLLPTLIRNPLSVIFKNENVSPPTKIDCDIMFYSKAKNDNAIIHLGIKQDTQLGYYIPKTFFIEKVSSKQDDIYLAKQEDIEITVLNRTIML